MIIDFRVRPPYKSIKESLLYTRKPRSEEKWGLKTSQSIIEESMELFIEEMDEAGITKAVVPLRRAFGHKNEDLLSLMEEYPERFIGSPCIDPNLDIQLCLQEIRDYVIKGPCSVIMMEPGKCKEPMHANDKRIWPIYEMCQENKIPVLLSFGGFIPPALCYNNPLEIEEIAMAFPDLTIVVCHAAWPYVQEIIHVAFFQKNVYLVPDMYMVNCAGAQDYIAAANYMLQDKIILGSAYPILSMKENVEYVKSKVRPEVWPKISYKNAAKILDLE